MERARGGSGGCGWVHAKARRGEGFGDAGSLISIVSPEFGVPGIRPEFGVDCHRDRGGSEKIMEL